MLSQLKQFFEQHLSPGSSEKLSAEQLRLISVALFLEMMAMDDKCEPAERELIQALIQKNYSLNSDEASALIALAEQERKQATDYFEFTSKINKTFSLEEKFQIIESLWKIALIDGILDEQEEYLVRKIAGLLHVPDTDLIRIKNRVVQ